MGEFLVIKDDDKEYFCNDCGQLRFALGFLPTKCFECSSKNIVVGEVGELDKDTLKAEFWKSKELPK